MFSRRNFPEQSGYKTCTHNIFHNTLNNVVFTDLYSNTPEQSSNADFGKMTLKKYKLRLKKMKYCRVAPMHVMSTVFYFEGFGIYSGIGL